MRADISDVSKVLPEVTTPLSPPNIVAVRSASMLTCFQSLQRSHAAFAV